MTVTRLIFFALLLLATPVYSVKAVEENSVGKSLLTIQAYDPSGTWNIEIDVPGRTGEGIIVISKNDKGEYEVSMEDTSEDETVELEEVSFDEEEMIMTAKANVDGSTFDIELEFDGDTIEGKVSVEGMEMKLTGERETD